VPCYDGETLAQTLLRGPIGLKRALGLAVQAGRGLSVAHDELIVHCDVKPANLFLTRSETIKVLDFGVARALRDAGANTGQEVFGTPAYMAPEQLRRGYVDQRADVWGLGVVLFEMVVGAPPFPFGRADLVDAILHAPHTPPSSKRPELPRALDAIVDKALAKDPRDRYERMDLLVNDLLALQSGIDSEALTLRVPSARARAWITVLPFDDMSPAKDQGFLCDGIAEEVLRPLSRIPDLYVTSRTSASSSSTRRWTCARSARA
jgi:eukaryotic-like serine/threonine-protein kinase